MRAAPKKSLGQHFLVDENILRVVERLAALPLLPMDPTEPTLRVGELARRTGLTVRTLHHYDAVGLVRPSARTASSGSPSARSETTCWSRATSAAV